MSRVIVTRTICDMCFSANEGEVDATGTHVVTMDKQTVELDLCDLDAKKLLSVLENAFAIGRRPERRAYRTKAQREAEEDVVRGNVVRAVQGRDVILARPAPRARPHSCPGCEHRSTTRTALRDHVRRTHRSSLSELEGRPAKTLMPCTEPGCVYQARGKAGLVSHVRFAHPVSK